MDGSAELKQLAHLLRVGAEAARSVAELRPKDGEAIVELARRAETMAWELDVIVDQQMAVAPSTPLLDGGSGPANTGPF